MSTAARSFWHECDRYHDIAKQVEHNIEVTHPDAVSGRSGYCSMTCSYCARNVTYYEYRGPSI